MIETSRFTLPNGLRVIHNYDSATVMVALNILYNVGSRDESPHLTGVAHLFEHLMFGGSKHIPDFDASIEAAGGMNNAWTSNDFTNFYDIVPAQNAETAFWLESDRMLGLAFNDKVLEVQRQVVIEEFKQQCLNLPYGDMGHHLRSLIYKEHPYRYPVIGKEIAHIEKVTQDDVKEFFFRHYAPNNAVLAISGNISADKAHRLAMKWMGDIPMRSIAQRTYSPEPKQTAPRWVLVSGNVPQTVVIVAFRMPEYQSSDYIVCDIITDLLASGRSSRFFRNLLMIDDSLFTEIDASISGSEEPGFLMLIGKLKKIGTHVAAENALIDEAQKLAKEGEVTQYELTKTINRFESNFTFSNMNFLAKAQALAFYEMHGEDINDIVPRYRSITATSIQKVAEKIFDRNNCSILVYDPATTAVE